MTLQEWRKLDKFSRYPWWYRLPLKTRGWLFASWVVLISAITVAAFRL